MVKTYIANVIISIYTILNVIRVEFLGLHDIYFWDRISSVCSLLLLLLIFFRTLTLFTLRLAIFNMGLLLIQAVKEYFLNPHDDLPSDWVLMVPFILVACIVHHFPWAMKGLTKTNHRYGRPERLNRKGRGSS